MPQPEEHQEQGCKATPDNLVGHGRFGFSYIEQRPKWTWPNGKLLAVYIAVNMEAFDWCGRGAQLAPSDGQPDVLNWSWREYGSRVGGARLLSLLKDEFSLPCALLVNSSVYKHCPAAAKAWTDRGGVELVGHGWSNSERQSDMEPRQEAAMIERSLDVLEQEGGQRPKGWLGPWIAESHSTPDLLQEAGCSYVLDWAHDDQPTWLRTRQGRILSVPYPQELNDIPAIVARKDSPQQFADSIIDGLEEQLQQAKQHGQALVMGISLHTYLVGQPHRLRHLRRAMQRIRALSEEIWLTTPGAIAEAAAALPEGTLPS